jgi:uncharacterized repeat protein (TIGR01451 family)
MRCLGRSLWLVALLLPNAALAWKMEAGTVTIQNTFNVANFTPVVFQQTYDVTPLVFMLPSEQGGDPSDIRVRAVTPLGFEAVQAEPAGNDGPHVAMTAHYIVIEPGSYELPNGTRIQAGSVNTAERQRAFNSPLITLPPQPPLPAEGWEDVTFPDAFSTTPVVVAQIQTMNNETGLPPASFSQPWLTTAIDNVNASGFDAALERSGANNGSVILAENFGWLAMEIGAFDTFEDNSGNNVNVTAARSGRLGGWDGTNNIITVNYTDLGAGAQPIIGASLNNHRDNDGGWVRYRQNTQDRDSVQLRGDEDRDLDNERSKNNGQSNETGVIAFSRAFNAEFGEPDIVFMKLVDQVVSDPINGVSNPKAIPEAVVQYRLNAGNHGDGPATDVVLSDAVPTNTTLFVGDINGANSGPVRFQDGSPSSGLVYNYNPLAPTLDSLEFSNDGGNNWAYQPTPDADGFDNAVTHYRINFLNEFSHSNTGTPQFDLYFRIRVD